MANIPEYDYIQQDNGLFDIVRSTDGWENVVTIATGVDSESVFSLITEDVWSQDGKKFGIRKLSGVTYYEV